MLRIVVCLTLFSSGLRCAVSRLRAIGRTPDRRLSASSPGLWAALVLWVAVSRAEALQVTVDFAVADAQTAAQIDRVLSRVEGTLSKWGQYRQSVRIRVHPDHAALETAVNRQGYAWLRAWARATSIDLQSPRSWSLFGASDAQVEELLTHELAHCLMYQRATPADAPLKRVPTWFREGYASVVAEQGYRRPAELELWRSLQESESRGGLLDDDEAKYRGESGLVYGIAHRAFEFLLRRYGLGAVEAILDRLARQEAFETAFTRVIGLPTARFSDDFERYVRWEGWRVRVPPQRSPPVDWRLPLLPWPR